MTVEWILGGIWQHIYWIHLAQDREQWLDLVNKVKNLRIS